jgi:hypothetical protein
MSLLTKHWFRQYHLTASLVALVFLPTPMLAQSLSDTPWTEYFGSSEGPHAGWGNTTRIGSDQTRGINQALLAGDDIVVTDGYGLGSARKEAGVAQFMDSIEADGGQSFRQIIFDRAVILDQSLFDFGATNQVLLMQFGNEITSIDYALNLRSWAGQPVQPTLAADSFIIPYYAEYYLAPAVQALREAEVVTGTNIPVMLGSIGNANTPNRRKFLYELLNYQLVGTYAGTLTGLRVADIVDHIDIHYMIAKDTHVTNVKGKNIKHLQGSFELALNEIYDPWVATGILDGLWSTEEVGAQSGQSGNGALTAIVVTARYLHWWGENGLSKGQGRSLFWGTNLGPANVSADLAMRTLFGFLGATPLIEIPGAVVPPANDWETYLFEAVDDVNKRVGFVIPSWRDVVSGTFTTFNIDATDWPGEVSAEVFVFGLGASTSTIATVDRQGDVLTITVPTPILAETDSPPAIVIFLQRN